MNGKQPQICRCKWKQNRQHNRTTKTEYSTVEVNVHSIVIMKLEGGGAASNK